MAVGEPASTCAEFEKKNADPDVEIVTTSGYGKNGAICVLQRTIKPQVVTTFELPGVNEMFTVFAPRSVEDTFMHSYLLLSRSDSTMVGQSFTWIFERLLTVTIMSRSCKRDKKSTKWISQDSTLLAQQCWPQIWAITSLLFKSVPLAYGCLM